ncbi:translation initiation factor IF-2 [Kwoniella dejecticola CBS 10117]|uniref:Translation initiation factor IF-2, mitochondrial n=1 Tax=Kwoniella dejecticola CBS 10117 TaxID=1296121 RepID=A0A1A6A9E6_9TREE|nr:translation initiation factor IF-2 [Kwoniella dejecticola CBS 10117]OBR86676.1 translation initiation factor IF-2 [Kwoniella dejecticola CBS 10117]
MALIAPISYCRCCRGVLHTASSSSRRTFASTSYASAERNEGFKLPSRDWSVRPPQQGSNGADGPKRGQRPERGPRRTEGRPNEGRQSSIGGSSNNRKPRPPFRNDRGSSAQSANKWGASRGSPRESEINLTSGFGLKSAKSKTDDNTAGVGGLRELIEKSKKTNRIQRVPQQKSKGSAAFSDLLGGNSTSDNSAAQSFKERSSSVPDGERGEPPSTGDDASALAEDSSDMDEYGRRSLGSRDRRHSHARREGGSLLSRLSEEEELALPSRPHHNHKRNPHPPPSTSNSNDQVPRKPKIIKPKVMEQEKQVYIPRTISVANLAKIFGVKLFHLQTRMSRLDMSEDQRRSDYLLNAEQACDIAIEYGFDPVVDDEASFDIYPDPETADGIEHPLRPPVVTIMGHVDHGKTTLLDSLRHTSVAAGEAGGITQHIGAFSVPLSSLLPAGSLANSSSPSTITFLDTPGHAAFTAMRARGASVTDIVVLVVAADDGVMPQTKEVLELVKSEGDKVGLVVAINKCDKPGVDFNKVKSALGAEGIHLEEDGGDVPSVKVSGLAKMGLDDLVETLSTLAEIRDLRARKEGKAEGYVLESRVDRGRGNVATVLITRGTLKTGSSIVAGQTWCRVRQMQDDKGKPIKEALPGQPVSITGWKELPSAGDELLEAIKGEDEAKKAINNRKRDEERRRMMVDVEQINAKRKEERERLEADALAAEALESGESTSEGGAAVNKEEEKKILRLVIKADVSGTVEAVVGSLEHIGNKEAGVKIIHTGVGEVSESDVALAEASDATIIGFSVNASRSIQTLAKSQQVSLQLESVIYRLIDTVRTKVAGLLPPKIEYSVKGEAVVQQLFQINIKRKETVTIAGCRMNNGVINKLEGVVRVLRGKDREVIYEGKIETLKHLKKEVSEVRKGMECGIALEGFTDIKEGDEIVTYNKIEVPREL